MDTFGVGNNSKDKIQGWRVKERQRETVNIKSKATGVEVFVTQIRILEILLFLFPWSFQQVGILAATSLQSCPTLCDPIDGSPPGSAVPGILQARTLEWVPFPSPMHESEKWKWSHSVVSNPQWPHGPQPSRLLHPWDFPGKSTGVECHCLLLEYLEWRQMNTEELTCLWSLVKYLTLGLLTCKTG